MHRLHGARHKELLLNHNMFEEFTLTEVYVPFPVFTSFQQIKHTVKYLWFLTAKLLQLDNQIRTSLTPIPITKSKALKFKVIQISESYVCELQIKIVICHSFLPHHICQHWTRNCQHFTEGKFETTLE